MDKIFYRRYVEANARYRFAAENLAFMFWRRGSFCDPRKSQDILQQFAAEEQQCLEKGEWHLPSLQFLTNSSCTLACRDCNGLIPYWRAPHYTLTPEALRSDLEVLATCVSKIHRFLLLGGEPFLHPQLADLLHVCAEFPMINFVEVVTNATVIPSTKFLKAAAPLRDKFYVKISDYSRNPFVQSKIHFTELVESLKEYDIRSKKFIYPYWNSFLPFATKKRKNAPLLSQCYISNCLQILDGRLSVCPSVSAALHNKLVDSSFASECVDIRTSQNLPEELLRFYSREQFSLCDYCMSSEERVMPAIQLERRRSCSGETSHE